MEKKDSVSRALATLGTVLVWFPVLTPFFFAVLGSIRGRMPLFSHFDYLMPAELFPLAMFGGALLLWAALRTRSRRWLIGGSLGSAVLLPVAGQVIALITGLASGRTEPTGWQWALVLACLALYVLALVILGIGGVLLLRDLSKTA